MSAAIALLRTDLGTEADRVTSARDDSGIEAVMASAANDDFESGTLAGWRADSRGSGVWAVYRNGQTTPRAKEAIDRSARSFGEE